MAVSCVQGLSFLPQVPKYKISDIIVLYGMLAEKDFGKICKAFLSCSRRNKGMGRFLCRIIFKTVHPKSNSFSSRNVKLFVENIIPVRVNVPVLHIAEGVKGSYKHIVWLIVYLE